MAKLIRKVAFEFTGFVWSRLTAPRKKLCVPVTICLEPESKITDKTIFLRGETKDLSKSGAAFILSSIRIREKYLVGENRPLYVELDLPNGKAKMEFVGCRYEQLGIHDTVATYLVGARITYASQHDRMLYEEYLELGDALKSAEKTDFTVKAQES